MECETGLKSNCLRELLKELRKDVAESALTLWLEMPVIALKESLIQPRRFTGESR